ncbi:hypothetical protein MKW94_002705 [Papaver nudicaule]|uniref:Glycosyltransferase n=1 Tax=Papaver nudicaule TaxID=74823 RepID=A0AA42AVY9_PAPNU|nr:hypothetical protein [Papaver nudicaule]
MTNTTTATATISTARGGGGHILVFPFPAQGHMLPLLDLVHQFALRATTTTTITILVTPKNLPILNPLLIQHPFIVQTLVLPFPTPQDSPIPPGVENVKNLPPSYFLPMITTMSKLHDPILNWFQSHPSPPTCIVSDMFLGWTQDLASQLGIRRICFCPSGALTLSISACLWGDLPTPVNHGNDNMDELISFPKVPGCPSYPWWQLSPLYRAYVQGKKNHSSSADLELLRRDFLANVESWGMVYNSFHELEGIYLDHMKRAYFGNKRVWAVGPLSQSGPTERGGTSSNGANDIIPWLDTCEDHSVVYICFGSQAVLNNSQMEALAVGLEKSGVRFVWCVKEPTLGHVSGEYGMVPSWFEDRTADRGLVIRGWAPQVLILKHKAIGSFLTHCGWNSVLESVDAGVPMLAWPMGADQFMNATLLVDQMKVAVRVCEGEKTIPDAEELAQCMAESVATGSTSKNEMRLRAKELKQAATDAVSGDENGGGSSFNDLDDLVHHLLPNQ